MQLSTGKILVALVAAAFLPRSTEANAFLRKQPRFETQPRVEILDLLEEELGSDHGRTDEARVMELQGELNHTFAALPKNSYGNLQAAGARYALHRLFVQRHAWQFQGLEPRGDGWSNDSFADALGDALPQKAQMLFKERFGELGVSLHELAVMAALLESMVHVEVDDRLQIALQALGTSPTASLDKDEATEVFDAYMASYIAGVPLAKLTPAGVRKAVAIAVKAYPTWPDTQAFVRSVRDSSTNGAARYNFSLMSDVISKIGHLYGRWQSKECSALKAKLVKLEARPGSGRVRLSDFYGSAISGENWEFSESIDYLRQLGVLDESSSSEPSVVIPNYIGSPSNCVASSGYYSVCCLDECEELMDHLELQLGAPAASVDSIARALSGMPSEEPAANRTPSDALLRRLSEVAAHHQGEVPLHGRLFAQWMHHAYPRDCRYPHVSGTTNPLQVTEYRAKTGMKAVASKEEMQGFAAAAAPRTRAEEELEDGLCSNMWTIEEELVDPSAYETHQSSRRKQQDAGAAMRSFMFCAAIVSMILTLAKAATSISKADPDEGLVARGFAVNSKGVTYSV